MLLRTWRRQKCYPRTLLTSTVQPTVYEKRQVTQSTLDASPGKDYVCYMMLSNLSEFYLARLLELCNKIWRGRQA